MENQVNPAAVPSAYDYRLYDRIWRRVSPELDPYPEVRAASAPSAARAETPHTIQVSPTAQNTQAARSAQATQTTQAAAPAPAGGTVSAGGGLEGLPGADANPCCMGTQAQVSVGVLTGFIEEEAASRRHYLILARHTRSQQAAAHLRRGEAGAGPAPAGGLLPHYRGELHPRRHGRAAGLPSPARYAAGRVPPGGL